MSRGGSIVQGVSCNKEAHSRSSRDAREVEYPVHYLRYRSTGSRWDEASPFKGSTTTWEDHHPVSSSGGPRDWPTQTAMMEGMAIGDWLLAVGLFSNGPGWIFRHLHVAFFSWGLGGGKWGGKGGGMTIGIYQGEFCRQESGIPP